MNVSVDSTRRNDEAFPGKGFSRRSDSHSGSNSIHRVRISRLADSSDFAVLYTDVSLVNSRVIKNYAVRDYKVKVT